MSSPTDRTPSAATPLEPLDIRRQFALWCAEAGLAVDYQSQHFEAFWAGYKRGCEDEYNAYLRGAVT